MNVICGGMCRSYVVSSIMYLSDKYTKVVVA